LTLKRDCAQLQAAAWNEDRRTGDTLYGKHSIQLVPVLEELKKLQEEQAALAGDEDITKPVEIQRIFRLEGNALLKVSPTLKLVFSIPIERKLQEKKKASAEEDKVKAAASCSC